jgi:inosine-uridine nucleoside N-ribohydrolase
MKHSRILVILCCAWAVLSCQPKTVPAGTDTVKIILDTDIGPDYDDVGATAFLHAMADSGRAEILATISCNRDSLVVPTLDVLNTYFGKPDIPTGAPTTDGVSMASSQHWPDSLVERFPHRITSTKLAPDAVVQYRSILADQPDHSVVIVTVGFLTNLSNLLKSGADQASPLNGMDLVEKKVKRLVSMAGKFPEGKEFNVHMDSAASRYCLEKWPTEIIFSGFEIGEKVKTGLKLVSLGRPDNPVREAYRIAMSHSSEDASGRMSWDQTALCIAVYGIEPFFSDVRGRIVVNSNGSNGWENNQEGKHSYVRFKMAPDSLASFIERRMMHIPQKLTKQ